MKQKLFFCAITLVSFMTAYSSNILKNGGFENDLANWPVINTYAGAEISIDATVSTTGSKSAKIQVNVTPAVLDASALTSIFTFQKNALYKVRFKAKASAVTTLAVIMKDLYVEGNILQSNAELTTSFQQFEFTTSDPIVASNHNGALMFSYIQVSNGITIWIDDVELSILSGTGFYNVVANGNFEESVQNPRDIGWWLGSNNASVSIDSSSKLSGVNSFHLQRNDVVGDWLQLQIHPWLSLQQGSKYKVSFKAVGSANNMHVGVFLNYLNVWWGNYYNGASTISTTPATYTHFTNEWLVEASFANPTVLRFIDFSVGDTWIDDIRILPYSINLSATTINSGSAPGTIIGELLPLTDETDITYTLSLPDMSADASYSNQLFSVDGLQLKSNAALTVGDKKIKIGITDNNGAYITNDFIITVNQDIVPNSPTSVVATAGNTKASVAFIAPASNGGSAIVDYTATSSPGGLTVTGTSSPLTVTGLTNGTAYSFTVTARNTVGSSSGGASSAVTPHATNNNFAVSTSTNISSLTLTPVSDIVVSGDKLTINAAKIVNSITVAPGAQLELTSGNTLTAGTVTLQSDATGTATLVDNTTSSPQAITATVQQYVEAGRNWYMSIPLASGASSLLNRGTSVVCYDEPTSAWVAPAAGTLNKLRGYIQTATASPLTGSTGSVDFTGVVNTGAHSITLSRTTGQTGFNLVGNPYPSYLDWNMVTKTNVSNTMWFRTKEGSVYKFYTYIANSGAGVGSPATVTNKIPPMQAFWVRVNTVGTGSIAVDNNMRSHKDVAGNLMKAPKQTSQQLLRLRVSNGTNTDETVLYFNANASDTFDQYDAQKRSNNDLAIPEIFTQIGNEQLVINGMNSVKLNTEIPIGFSTEQANSFSISANEMTNFESGTRVILIDKQNPTIETELSNGAAYTFSAPITAATTNRFSLLFRAPSVTTGIDNAAKIKVQVFVNINNQITIIAAENSIFGIYNAMGQLIENGVLNTERETRNSKLNSGVYVVKVNNQSTRVIIK